MTFISPPLSLSRTSVAVAALVAVAFANLLAGGADPPPTQSSDKRALAALQNFVGQWRGVGQPKRGSNQGAWTEEFEWAWKFDKDRAELLADLTGDKYYRRFQLQAADKPGRFVLLATPAGDADEKSLVQRFNGAMDGDALVLTADGSGGEQPTRISFRLVAGGDRMVALYERRAGDGFSRLAEIGSTRKGSSFATSAASGRECVVTGGLGTIAVEHDGKTYYVCCSGCRELFNDDPAAALAEYRERKEAERKAKAQ